MRSSLTYALLLVLSLPLRASESSGTKMTVRYISDGHSFERTVYWRSDRKRMEYRNSSDYRPGPRLAAITRCDLGQTFELNLDSSQYVSAPYPPKPYTKEQVRAQGLDQQKIAWSEKPLIRIEIKTVDTGERKQLFGHTARHVIATRKLTPFEGSHSQPEESVRNGWYIDLNQQISCDPDYMRKVSGYAYASLVVDFAGKNQSQAMDKPEFVTEGKPETGFALQEVVTSDNAYKSADGTPTRHARSKFETAVTELQEGPLDPALFEVPHGFKHVKQIERNPPLEPVNPMREFWELVKYTVTNWFTLD